MTPIVFERSAFLNGRPLSKFRIWTFKNTRFLKTSRARRFKNQRKIELSDIQPSKRQCFSRLAAPGLTCSAPLTKAGRQTIYSNSRSTAIGRFTRMRGAGNGLDFSLHQRGLQPRLRCCMDLNLGIVWLSDSAILGCKSWTYISNMIPHSLS